MCIIFFSLVFSNHFGMQSEYLGLIMIGLNESHASVAANQFGLRSKLRYIYDTTKVYSKVNKFYYTCNYYMEAVTQTALMSTLPQL